MAASLVGLGLFVGGARAPAQELPLLPPTTDPTADSISLPPIPEPSTTLPAPRPVPDTTLPPPPREKILHFSRDPMPILRSAPPAADKAASPRPAAQRLAVQNLSPLRSRDQRKEQQSDESVQYLVPTEAPSPGRIFATMQSDENLMERIRQERRSQNTVERVVFPEETVLSKVAYAGRRWEPLKEEVQPGYVIYRRLLFEQRNGERYGWDVGVVHPLLAALKTYADVVTLPYHLGTRPFQQFESSAGLGLPGDPAPLLLYPPEWSLTGMGLETAVLVPFFFAFP